MGESLRQNRNKLFYKMNYILINLFLELTVLKLPESCSQT